MGNWRGPAGDARPYSGRPSLLRTPVLTQDARPLPEVTISKKRRQARPSTYRTAAFKKDGRRGRDYRTPGPWRPDGTVGNTAPVYQLSIKVQLLFSCLYILAFFPFFPFFPNYSSVVCTNEIPNDISSSP